MLSKLSVSLLLPCLLFCNIARDLTISDISEFALVLLYCVLHIVIGCALGFLASLILRVDTNHRKLMMANIGFQDTTAIALVYASVLGDADLEGIESDFSDKATGYVLIYSVFVVVFNWTCAFKILEKSTPSCTEEPILTIQIETNGTESKDPCDPDVKPMNCFKRFIIKAKQVMNPPIYAGILAIPFALIPYVKEYVLVGSGSVLGKNVYAGLSIIGSTAAPVIDFVLGIKLSKGCPQNADIGWAAIIAIILGKLVIMPAIGFGLVHIAYSLGIMVIYR